MSRGAQLVVILGLVACNSDALSDSAAPESTGEPASTGGSSTGIAPTTGEPASTGSTGAASTGAVTTGEPPPPDKSCDDFLKCIGPCLLTMDPMCLTGCADGLSPDALPKLGALGLCVGQNCFEAGACSLQTLQDPACLACLGIGLINPNPPGCEEQADACMMSP